MRRLAPALAAACLLLATAARAEPPLVLGHRGLAWDHGGNPYPENSVESVQAALAAGADGVEVDVYKTLDDVLVLAHEDPLDARHRTRRPRSTCRATITLSEWVDIAHCRLQPGDPAAADVPLGRLEQIIDLPGLDLLVIDVKNDQAGHDLDATIAAVARVVHGHGLGERVVLMVYTHSGLGLATRHGLRACLKRHLWRGFTPEQATAELVAMGAWGQCASSAIVDRPAMAALNAAGVRQVPYLLGHGIRDAALADLWRRFGALGVYAIITDRVAAAAQARAAQRRAPPDAAAPSPRR